MTRVFYKAVPEKSSPGFAHSPYLIEPSVLSFKTVSGNDRPLAT